MNGRAKNQSADGTGKFSTLDWPTPEMLRAAQHTRSMAIRDAILTLAERWANSRQSAAMAHGSGQSPSGAKSHHTLLRRFQLRAILEQMRRFLGAPSASAVTGASIPRAAIRITPL